MRTFALNHMTTPRLPVGELFALANELGCVGVELRNDLDSPLFDGAPPDVVGALAKEQGLSILALAEVSAFDDGSERAYRDLRTLATLASRCGALGISLIPRNDGAVDAGSVQARRAISRALDLAAPVLEDHGLIGYVEPLGFASASLRFKADAVDLIESSGHSDRFQLIHDTFHHHVSGETAFFATHTGLVHISGVSRRGLATHEMCDADRGLVDDKDQLGNVEQLDALASAGYVGPISVEAFAPSTHGLDAPQLALAQQFQTLRSNFSASAA